MNIKICSTVIVFFASFNLAASEIKSKLLQRNNNGINRGNYITVNSSIQVTAFLAATPLNSLFYRLADIIISSVFRDCLAHYHHAWLHSLSTLQFEKFPER